MKGTLIEILNITDNEPNPLQDMNTENLISLADFARESGLRPDEVTRLTNPKRIETVDIGGKKFIDKTIYPPKDYKKKDSE